MKGHARDLMTSHTVQVTVETSLAVLVQMLVVEELGGLPVVDADEQVIGFVSETEVMAALLAGKALSTPASALMTSPAEVVDEFATTDGVTALLRTRKIHHLPVVRAGKLVGTISPLDVLKYFLKHSLPPPQEAS